MDASIASLLERLARVCRVLLWDAAKETGVSPIQIQILLYLSTHPAKTCTVGVLSREYSLTVPTVSDAVSSLVRKGLVAKRSHRTDARVVPLQTTGAGRSVVRRVSRWADVLTRQISAFSPGVKESAMVFLMDLIKALQHSGVNLIVYMCITCHNFRRNVHPGSEEPHHCMLTSMPLAVPHLQVDCPHHSLRSGTNPGPSLPRAHRARGRDTHAS